MSGCRIGGIVLGLALLSSGCNDAYEAPMNARSASTGTEPQATDSPSTPAADVAPPVEATAKPAKQPGVESSGPVGRTLLAPSDALDGIE